jgi:hypothetical protein
VGHEFTDRQLMEEIEAQDTGPGSLQHVPTLGTEKAHGSNRSAL